jgi:hypothetical protein
MLGRRAAIARIAPVCVSSNCLTIKFILFASV